ncbi:MAG: hypothetical protein IPJ65_38520 [Archangiaceae bacterium]|nr:hypothetical protein [Archangiaceae bacterium]
MGKPATGLLGQCPPCQNDDDCKVLSNLCEPQAYCVHKDSSWVSNATTCTEQRTYLPTLQYCRCLANGCDWHAF